MRRTALVIASLFLALPAAAQHIVGTILNGGFVQLVNVDPSTGACSLIGSATDSSTLYSKTAYDSTNNFYYFLGNNGVNDRLYRVHTGSGTFSSVAISGVTQSNVRDLEYDSANSTLYAIIAVGLGLQLATVNTSTGVITPVGSAFLSGASLTFSGMSKLDPGAGHWFFDGSPNVYGIDMTTNDIYHQAAEPGPNPLVAMQAGGGGWYFLQFTGADGRLIQLDTSNTASFGTVTQTGSGLTGGTLSVTGGTDTFDSAGGVFYFVGTLNGGALSLFAVNASTRTLVAGYPKTLTGTGTNYSNAEFDAGILPVKLQRFRAD